MDRKTAKELLPLLNDPTNYSLLHKYVAGRVEVLRKQLESAKEHSRVLEIQGAIAELRLFDTLREQAINRAKDRTNI